MLGPPLVLLLAAAPAAQAAPVSGAWVLTRSTLAYSASHLLHHSRGVSHAARGKAACSGEACDILVAAPVTSFDSGDSNRDLHMLEVTRGLKHPLVVVRARLAPRPDGAAKELLADVQVEFAGETVDFPSLRFRIVENTGTSVRMTGTVPATLSAFHIKPPSLLAMPLKDRIPVRLDLGWEKQ